MLLPPQRHSQLLEIVSKIDPVYYAQTRNDISGGVTRLSPYISRGVLSTKEVMEVLRCRGFSWKACESLLKELAWRDYFQRVQEIYPDLHHRAIKQEQTGVKYFECPKNVIEASTGIEGIDQGIENLMQVGYVHNHQRMYIAMLCCNIGQYHWKKCADWMYYHLIDGDVASNYCSWQWTAGAFSSKRYVANQENINHYTHTTQRNTFLDLDYDSLREMAVPEALQTSVAFTPHVWTAEMINALLGCRIPIFNAESGCEKVVLYNTYQLKQDDWIADSHRKVLLLEPSFLQAFPISEKVLDWIITQAMLIDGIEVYVGDWAQWRSSFPMLENYYVHHPLFQQYEGNCLERDWMFPEVSGYYPSFFAYWKQVEKRYSWQ